ncbi:DHRS1 [Lepeophtheirus salmonis]|uniref:(salmon louse) hypothetical protein n=1 Tax=Lepeophtheirus salmonis TaxID=72036 RepID=A0A817FBU0_LEPSM|nr:unnamed protein product [Lepeophtheirus salmonis]CAF2743764.1 DHRS1 [Lepeophtheirus salmonis]CAG9476934.1 unnamed protein product [Lepeophtheirus salmonis]CAG9476936.1 DHRS1 [Lepeophtheirus salmonis]
MNAWDWAFYECPTPNMWDKINGVGLRNHYLCTVYASRIMVENRTGLILNISSGGGLKYLLNVPYGIGPVKTEEITNRVLENPEARNSAKRTFESGESTEFTGMAIVKLASDPNTIQCTGKILLTSFLARKYDIKDLNGTITGDMFSLKNILQLAQLRPTSVPFVDTALSMC